MLPPNVIASTALSPRVSTAPRRIFAHAIEPLEARIAPATFDLTGFNGPFTLKVDSADGKLHITGAGAVEIFDVGALTGDDLTVTGGVAGDLFNIGPSPIGPVSFTGTLAINIPGQIVVQSAATTGLDLALTSGSTITYSASTSLSSSAAHFTAARNIVFTNGAALSTVIGDIVLLANQAGGQNGNFTGISLDGASLSTSGTGKIQLSGKGGNLTNGNVGIALSNGSVISSTGTLANAGSITLRGDGGVGGADNHGVFLAGGTTAISSARGAIGVTGTGNGTGAGNNVGVLLSNGAQLISSGTAPNAATITVIGAGGAGADFNRGVFLDGSGLDPRITTIDGPVVINGQGGPSATGQGARGISIEQGAQVLASGAGSINLQGTGGGGTDNRQGILISQAGSAVSIVNGSVSAVGIGGAAAGGASNNGVLVTAGGKVSASGTGLVSLEGTEGSGGNSEGISLTGANTLVEAQANAGVATVQLIANNLNIDPNASIDTNGGGALLRPRNNGIATDLGGPDTAGLVLGLTNGELARINSATVEIGGPNSGRIRLSTPINTNFSLTLTTDEEVFSPESLTLPPGANLTINTQDGIDFAAFVTVPGTASFSSGLLTNISVFGEFGTVNIPGGHNVSVRDDTGFNLGSANVAGILTVSSNGTIVQTGSINGAGELTKDGDGPLVLTAQNTYSGPTTINDGTIQVGDGGTTGTLGNAAVTNNAVLTFNRSNDFDVANVISGSGDLTKNGTGALTLTATSTYTGSTTVAAGRLVVNGTLPNTVGVGVATPAALEGTGTIGGPVNVFGGLGPGGNPGTLRTGNVTFSPAARFTVEVNGALPNHDQLAVTGTVDLNNALFSAIGTIGSVPGQQIVLIANDGVDPVTGTFSGFEEGSPVMINNVTFTITYAGGTDGNDVVLAQAAVETEITLAAGNLVINDIAPGGHNATLTIQDQTATTGRFVITDPARNLTFTGIAGATLSGDLHSVTIPATAITGPQILVNGLGGDDSLTVDSRLGPLTKALVFDGGAQGVSGDRLVLLGAAASATHEFTDLQSGSVTLPGSAAISYLGLEVIDSQILAPTITLNYNASAANTITVVDLGGGKTSVNALTGTAFSVTNPAATLTINGGPGGDTFLINSLSSFPGALVVNGQGGDDTVTLAAGLPTLGGLTIATETIAALPALGLGGGGLDLTASTGGLAVNGPITSTGLVRLQSGDAITSAAVNIAAPQVIARAVNGIALGLDGATVTADNTAAGGVTFRAVNNPVTINVIIPGSGGVALTAGNFRLSKTDAIDGSPALALGAALDLDGFFQNIGTLSGAGSITNTSPALSVFTLGSDASATYTGTLSGHLALEKVGVGTQTLGGAHNAVDGTTVRAGTLQFDVFGSALNGPFTLAGGAVVYNFGGTFSPKINLTADSAIGVSGNATVALTDLLTGPGGLTKTGAGTLILANEKNSFGPSKVRILGGTLQVARDGALGDPGNDVEINDATFFASAAFASARNFTRTGGEPTITTAATELILINKAIVPTDFLLSSFVKFAFTYADTTPVPEQAIVVGNTAVSLGGAGTLVIHKTTPTSTTIDTIELTGTSSSTKLVIKAVDPNTVTTVLRIVIENPAPGTDPAAIASIGSIVLGKNVRLGDGVPDSVPDLYVEGKVGKLSLYDLNSHAIIRLGDGLPYDVPTNKKTPDTYNQQPDITIHSVLGPGVLIDVTPSDLVDSLNRPIGGGGLGKVLVDSWNFAGAIRTTQSMKSFKLKTGDSFVVFQIDKFHVGTVTTANVGSMTIQNGSWGSSGSEIEGEIGAFSADDFLAGATLTAGSMGKVTLDEGAFAGLLTLTDPDAAGIPTFIVAGDFTGAILSESPVKKIKVRGDFTGELAAPFIGSITAYAFLGTNTPGEYNQILATEGSLGTLTATAGVVKNFAIVTDQAFKGFNIKLGKLTTDTVGIDNVRITARSIGNISVSLAAAAGAGGVDLVGIRDSHFITTGTGTTKTTQGSIGNVTITLTGAAGSGNGTGIQGSSFDALVSAATVNPLGKIVVKINGHDGSSIGLEDASFAGNSIGTTVVTVTRGKSASASAVAIQGADLLATGAIGAMSLSGDATGAALVHGLTVAAGTTVGAITVKSKDLSHGTIEHSAILAGQLLDVSGSPTPARLALATLGAVKTTGSIVDTTLASGGSIGAVTIGQNLTASLILAGAKLRGDFLTDEDDFAIDGDETYQRSAAIASITVKLGFATTSIVAGIAPGNNHFGDGDDTAATNLAGTSSIGAITLGTANAPAVPLSGHQFAIQAGAIKSLKLGAGPAVKVSTDLFIDGEAAADVIVRVL